MKPRSLLAALCLLCTPLMAAAADGLVTLKSPHSSKVRLGYNDTAYLARRHAVPACAAAANLAKAVAGFSAAAVAP